MTDFRPDFLIIPMGLITDKNTSPLDGYVYAAVYWFHSLKDGRCFASNPSIAVVVNSTARSVQNSLTTLEKLGYISRTYDGKNREIQPLITFDRSSRSLKNGVIANKLKCHYCGIKDENGTIFEEDHYVPLSRGGKDHKSNIVISCRPCNQRKGSMTGDEYLSHLKNLLSPNGDSEYDQTVTKLSPGDDQISNTTLSNTKKVLHTPATEMRNFILAKIGRAHV